MTPAWLLGVSLILPQGSGIAARVVVPPAGSAAIEKMGWSDVRFALGPGDAVWFSHDGEEASNFTKGYRLKARTPFNDMAGVSGVGPMFVSGGDLGFLAVDAPASAAFQPVTALPVTAPRLFSGDAGTLYIVGRGKDGGRWEVWVLGRGRGLRKVLTSTERIAAAAGDGRTSYAAVGRLVGRVDEGSGAFKGVFLHPGEDVLSLAFSEAGGLFYATASGAGAAGTDGSVEFLRAPRAGLVARGTDLFVFLPDSLTLLRIEGAGKLRTYARNP
ncbi:MAG: hypothetical protein HY928_12140 [Elusimicrobia bacterium]|nr:hypothetical protein [Elusimicrobiota bacterium]